MAHFYAWAQYSQINADYLAARNRKWSKTSGKPDDNLRPFYWTKDADESFDSFERCFTAWMNRAANNSNIQLEKVFSIDKSDVEMLTEFALNKRRKGKFDFLSAASRNYDLMLELEEENECSGMCNAGLFYYGRDVSYGPPKRTCLKALEDVFKWAAPMGHIAKLLGATAFFVCLC